MRLARQIAADLGRSTTGADTGSVSGALSGSDGWPGLSRERRRRSVKPRYRTSSQSATSAVSSSPRTAARGHRRRAARDSCGGSSRGRRGRSSTRCPRSLWSEPLSGETGLSVKSLNCTGPSECLFLGKTLTLFSDDLTELKERHATITDPRGRPGRRRTTRRSQCPRSQRRHEVRLPTRSRRFAVRSGACAGARAPRGEPGIDVARLPSGGYRLLGRLHRGGSRVGLLPRRGD